MMELWVANTTFCWFLPAKFEKTEYFLNFEFCNYIAWFWLLHAWVFRGHMFFGGGFYVCGKLFRLLLFKEFSNFSRWGVLGISGTKILQCCMFHSNSQRGRRVFLSGFFTGKNLITLLQQSYVLSFFFSFIIFICSLFNIGCDILLSSSCFYSVVTYIVFNFFYNKFNIINEKS